ncbi:hypothetical protein ABK040_007381 [Willaertia magna]
MVDSHQNYNFTNIILKNKWKLQNKLGQGSFGCIYSAIDLFSNEEVAIKLEKADKNNKSLKVEVSILKQLLNCPNIVKYISCGRQELQSTLNTEKLLSTSSTNINATNNVTPNNVNVTNNIATPNTAPSSTPNTPVSNGNNSLNFHLINMNFMVMEKLGDNLAELRRKYNFTTLTTLQCIIQMITCLETVHKKGIIHRDIKPGNFMIGLGKKSNQIFLIDFGLSRYYQLANGQVKPPRGNVGFRGTPRYASINAHYGLELSRRDDLFSIFFILIEFLCGNLPWKKLKDKKVICQLKEKFVNHLNQSLRELKLNEYEELTIFGNYLRGLKYDEEPNYDFLRNLLWSIFEKEICTPKYSYIYNMWKEGNFLFDWETTSDDLESNHNTRGSGSGNSNNGNYQASVNNQLGQSNNNINNNTTTTNYLPQIITTNNSNGAITSSNNYGYMQSPRNVTPMSSNSNNLMILSNNTNNLNNNAMLGAHESVLDIHSMPTRIGKEEIKGVPRDNEKHVKCKCLVM